MSKFTPGPWEIRNQDIYGSNGMYIATWSGTIKDAQAIAALPELVEALESAISVMAGYEELQGWVKQYKQVLNKIEGKE